MFLPVAISVFAVLSAAGSATSPCPASAAAPCVITLDGATGTLSPSCRTPAWTGLVAFTLPGTFADTNRDGAWETVLELRLDPTRTCGCARFEVLYGNAPAGWSVHLGNSPTNDGHGGDQGTTPDAAELHVVDRTLTAFTALRDEHIDRLLAAELPDLARGVLALEVCNQTVDVRLRPPNRDASPLHFELGTLNSGLLMSFGAADPEAPSGRVLHAAFNRVIHRVRGAPSHGRTGSGVRRVTISLSP